MNNFGDKKPASTIPDGFPIGQQPSAPCSHDFELLRTVDCVSDDAYRTIKKKDVFYCRHCLEYREKVR